MTDPWTVEGTWLRCALHAHTTRSDGELAAKSLARHYERAGYDVLAITDHWRITDAPNESLLVIASVELNCILPGARDGHVLGFGVAAHEQELRELAREHADLPATADWIEAHGGVAYLAHPYWTGVTPGTLELPENVAGIEVFNAGLRARGRAGPLRSPLGRAAREGPPLPRDCHRRLPSPGLRLRSRVDVGTGARALEGSSTRRAGGRNVLRLHGTADFRCATRWRRDPGPMQPVPHGHARLGTGDRGVCERRTARLSARGPRARMRFGRVVVSARPRRACIGADTPVSR